MRYVDADIAERLRKSNLPPKEQRDKGEGQGPSTSPPVSRNFKRTEEDDDDEVWYS
jgi:hypothetical protein